MAIERSEVGPVRLAHFAAAVVFLHRGNLDSVKSGNIVLVIFGIPLIFDGEQMMAHRRASLDTNVV